MEERDISSLMGKTKEGREPDVTRPVCTLLGTELADKPENLPFASSLEF
jgi:hypothetical protein